VFDSGTLAQGETFEFTFEEAGEFDFFCSVHPDMTGTITVEG
jgi:plastocyanin